MRTLLLLALVLGGAVSLEAQVDWATRKGFWIGFGLGGGPNLSTGFDGETMWGYGGHLKLGWTLSQKFLLGAESLVWGRNDGGEKKRRGNVHVMTQFYPRATSGFFLKAGVGAAFAWADSGNTTVYDTEGFGAGFGLGYSDTVFDPVPFTVQLDYMLQVFAEEDVPGPGDVPGSNSMLLLTLGLTIP